MARSALRAVCFEMRRPGSLAELEVCQRPTFAVYTLGMTTPAPIRVRGNGPASAARVLACIVTLAGGALPSPASVAGEPPHWSRMPLARPAVPPGATNPIDAFVRARLSARGLKPAAPADPRTLLRRLAYDLTGLPPAADELEAFLRDPAPGAYERAVTRWLESPRHGEHWARHWLDVANYADTHGNDHDYARPQAWPYRDYVIRAWNEDKPYRQFVQEQVAGDVLFPDDPQATVALGFAAAGPWDHTLLVTVREDTTDHRLAQYLDRDNMVSTVIGTLQSVTIHCARCHNHKFDPISQREYYGLQAVFAGVDRANRPFDNDPDLHRRRQHLLAEQRALRRRETSVIAQLDSPAVRAAVARWEETRAREEKAWQPLDVISVTSTGGATLVRQADGSWLASGERPARDVYIVTVRQPAGRLAAVRLETLPDDRLPQHGPGRWDNGNFHLSEFRAFAATNAAEGGRPILWSRATADFNEGPGISIAQAIDGQDETHWGIHPRYGEAHWAIFEVGEPVSYPDSTVFTFVLEHRAKAPGHGIGRFRLSTRPDRPSVPPETLPASAMAALRVPSEARTPDEYRELALAILQSENARALAALPPPQSVWAIARDFPPDGENFKPAPEPRPIYVLARGEISKPGEQVGPGALSCLPGLSGALAIADAGNESLRRAALARWLTDDRNALTWRSIVNRVWAWHFGKGLCESPNDFGKMGGAPSHPELLDWLAVWFRDDAKGSFKALHRLIVTSETWKQTSLAAPGRGADDDNRLLGRQNRTRLSAEEVRDSLLALSGQLDLTMGGPPAIQFIAKGDATFNPGGNPAFVDYEHFDPDSPAARRRAVYRFLFRTVPDPFMDALDCPDGGAATPVRGESATAQQALALWNDAFLIRQAEHIAARLAADTAVASGLGRPSALADAAYRRILQRPATDRERDRLSSYVERHGLANACQVLLNSNEFLYLD